MFSRQGVQPHSSGTVQAVLGEGRVPCVDLESGRREESVGQMELLTRLKWPHKEYPDSAGAHAGDILTGLSPEAQAWGARGFGHWPAQKDKLAPVPPRAPQLDRLGMKQHLRQQSWPSPGRLSPTAPAQGILIQADA